MKLLITTGSGNSAPVEVPDDMELENLIALCQVDLPELLTTPIPQVLVIHNGKRLSDMKKSVKDLGLSNDDIVLMSGTQGSQAQPTRRPAPTAQPAGAPSGLPINIDFGSIRLPGRRGSNTQAPGTSSGLQGGMDDPVHVRDMLLNDPRLMSTLRQNNPPLAEALDSGDFAKFSDVLKEQAKKKQEEERMRMRALDPFDLEAQQFLEKEIQNKNIDSNLNMAFEHAPENFGVVTMLYIRMRVNGHEIKAFVDSGAQSTIMSVACAQRCNIMRLVDTRFSGIAKGVGTQKIIGRIHLARMDIENNHFPTSFTVLEDQSMDVLLGLDMLKRHQCILDLGKNCLIFGTTGTETKFLHENELPEHAKLNGNQQDATVSDDHALAEAMQKSAEEARGKLDSNSSAVGTSNGASKSDPSLPEATVKKIVDMGFERSAAIRELEACGGDMNTAIAALLAKSLTKPSGSG